MQIKETYQYKLRLDRTSKEIAAAGGITHQSMYDILNGRRNPTVSTMKKIIDWYNKVYKDDIWVEDFFTF